MEKLDMEGLSMFGLNKSAQRKFLNMTVNYVTLKKKQYYPQFALGKLDINTNVQFSIFLSGSRNGNDKKHMMNQTWVIDNGSG